MRGLAFESPLFKPPATNPGGNPGVPKGATCGFANQLKHSARDYLYMDLYVEIGPMRIIAGGFQREEGASSPWPRPWKRLICQHTGIAGGLEANSGSSR